MSYSTPVRKSYRNSMKLPFLTHDLPQEKIEELKTLIQKKRDVKEIIERIEEERKRIVILLQELKSKYQEVQSQEEKDTVAQKGIETYLSFEAHMQTLQNKIRSL